MLALFNQIFTLLINMIVNPIRLTSACCW